MKSNVFSILFILLTQVVFPQSKGGSGSSSALFPDQKMTSSELFTEPATKALENYELELLPGQKFDGWYYFWTFDDPQSANF